MGWTDFSYAKKGLIIGLIVGVLFGIYSNITICHTGPGGSSGCSTSFQEFFAGIEFLLWIGPYFLFKSIIPDSMLAYKILILISPVVIFSLLGLLIGWIIGKFKIRK